MSLRVILLSIIAVISVAAAYFTFKSYTPPLFGANAIAQLREIDVNGDRQTILVRGHDRRAPVILFLHGGPGMPAMYLAHDFQRALEKDFVVVQWDQRGAGKSYRKDLSPDELTISQLLDDTEAVIAHLRKTLGAEKVWLIGHSHGSYLGALFAQRRPELISVLIGIGQTTDPDRERLIQDAYLKTRISDLGLPPDTEITGENREDLLFKTGSELYAARSFAPLIISGVMAPEYSLFDVLNVAKGSSFSSTHMTYDINDGALPNGQDFDVPTVIMMGTHDMVTPTVLAREYFESIKAPQKHWIEFDQSAHFPFFEEPKRFAEEMATLKNMLGKT